MIHDHAIMIKKAEATQKSPNLKKKKSSSNLRLGGKRTDIYKTSIFLTLTCTYLKSFKTLTRRVDFTEDGKKNF